MTCQLGLWQAWAVVADTVSIDEDLTVVIFTVRDRLGWKCGS